MHDFPPLLYGQVYGVVQAFSDLAGDAHAEGEVWQFLGASRQADRVLLSVVDPAAVRRTFALDAAGAARLGTWTQWVAQLPWQFRPTCACESPQLQQVLADPDCVAVVCPACRLVFAALPAEQQLQVQPLTEVQRDEVWEALLLPADATLAELLATILSVQAAPAVRVMAHKIAQRQEFAVELGEALQSELAGERLPALAVSARLPVPHPAIVAGLTRALQQPLDASPSADEAVLCLQAVLVHADALVASRLAVQALRDRVADLGGARAALLEHLAGNVLERMATAHTRVQPPAELGETPES